MPRERIHALDWLRSLSMLAVVTLHATSGYIYAESGLTAFGMNLAFLLNQGARFSVPTFFFLSGLGLGLTGEKRPGEFYLGRLRRVVLPYLLWCLIYAASDALLGRPVPLLSGILTGSFAAHLYFVPALVQLYLLYYPLRFCLRRAPGLTLAITFAATLYMHLATTLLFRGVHILPRVLQRWGHIALPTWIFYFTAGMYLTRERLARLTEAAGRHAWGYTAAWAAFSLVYAGIANAEGSADATPKLLVLLGFVPLTVMAVSGLSRRLPGMNRIMAYLARVSYPVYLCHVLALEVMRRLHLQGMRGMLLTLAGTLALSLAAAQLWSRFSAWARSRASIRPDPR